MALENEGVNFLGRWCRVRRVVAQLQDIVSDLLSILWGVHSNQFWANVL